MCESDAHKQKELDCALPKFIIIALDSRKHLLPVNDLLSFQPQTPCILATRLGVTPTCLNVMTYADSQKTSALKCVRVVDLHCVVSESELFVNKLRNTSVGRSRHLCILVLNSGRFTD